MNIVGYCWRTGAHLGNEKAKVIGNELQKLARENRVTPEEIVKEATPVDAPLHPFFEWNESRAAHKYRLAQAACYVRELEVIVDDKGKQVQTKSFVSVAVTKPDTGKPDPSSRVYVPSGDIITNPLVRQSVKGDLLKDLRAWCDRAIKLGFSEDFAPILTLVESMAK